MNYSITKGARGTARGGGWIGLDQKEKGLTNANGRNKMGSLNIHV